jgi:hypothetical protein
MATDTTQTRDLPPPYFAFKTLTNTVASMEEHGPPNRIDRSFLTGMSGAGQTQFIAGLKSLSLIDDEGMPQQPLVDLVTKPDERPKIIGQLLRARYPEAVELGQTNATTAELVDVFRNYGVSGDTARKAIAFYLQAARYAGDIPLSPHFKTPTVTRGPGGGRRRGRPPANREEEANLGQQNSGIPQELHPALIGLLEDVPKRGETWTKTEHDTFMAAFTAVLKIAAPIVEDGDASNDEETWE